MHATINLRTAVPMLLAASVSLSVFAPSRADVIVDWDNPEQWRFEITNVPDLDQKRSALPNNGIVYCVPTSAINWAAYFANHGLPALPPGPGDWEDQSRYDDATAAIISVSAIMFTDPNGGGTNKLNGLHGLGAWLSYAGDVFVVWGFFSDDDASPTIDFACANVLTGAYVIAGVGWYYDLGPWALRDGGHAVCLASGARNGYSWQVGIRDPGSDEDEQGLPADLTKQSPFTTEVYDIEHVYVRPMQYSDYRRMSKFPTYGGGGKVAILDSFLSIQPLFALTTDPLQPGKILKQRAMSLYGSAVPPIQEWDTSELRDVRSMAIHADLSSFLYITEESPARVWRLDPLSGASELVDLPFDDPREVMVSRRRDLYVLDGDDMVRVAIDVKPAREVGRVSPPVTMCAMAYEDETDELVLLAPDNQTIHRYLYHFDCDPEVKHILPEIPLSEKASMCWDATREAIWVISDASESVFMLTDLGPYSLQSQEFTHPQLTEPLDDIDCHDGGHVFVSSGGMLYEFELMEKGLELVDDPLFPEMQAGRNLCIARSGTNYVEELHGGEEYRDVLPETFAEPTDDCVGDVNSDGTVDVADLLALLGTWGDCPPDAFCHADFDYSGDVNTADLLALLAAWGPCEPLGACCLWDSTCVDLSANDCALRGESIWFGGEDCDTFQCPDWPTGACCVDGDCVETDTKYECSLLEGKWFEGQQCGRYVCPTAHCDADGECGQYISRVMMGEINNPSGCDGGYADYTNLAAEVVPGYVLQIIVNTTNPQPNDVCGIWVDWDRDFVFDDPRDFVGSADLSSGFWITQIGAPLDAKPGPTLLRLRLSMEEFPDPCGSLGPGEAEDYTLIVID